MDQNNILLSGRERHMKNYDIFWLKLSNFKKYLKVIYFVNIIYHLPFLCENTKFTLGAVAVLKQISPGKIAWVQYSYFSLPKKSSH